MEKIKWFKEKRFGMFIHFGLYSILGRGEWVMNIEQIPKDEYGLLADKFRPSKFNVEDWIKLAKMAGMKYVVFTAMHHDGFSLFDSKVSDFSSVKTAANRDFVAEYVEACRKYGMGIGIYYSLLDWRYKAYFDGPKRKPERWKNFLQYVHTQVEELCTNYGRIDILWYDGGWSPTPKAWNNFPPEEAWQSKKLNRMVRKLQPNILINDRSKVSEDFITLEQYIPTVAPAISAPDRLWESGMTMNDSWGYSKGDKNWKSSRQLIMNLVRCVSLGGSFILNVGPRPDGNIPFAAVRRLKEIGKWLKVNGESVYGAGISPFFKNERPYLPFSGGMVGLTTAKGNKVYLHVFRWAGKEICIGDVREKIKSAYLLANKKRLILHQKERKLFIRGLPQRPLDLYDTVIVLELK